MVRSREFDPQVALGQVVELFASRGYSDTSMEDIVRRTGVSRYGLYSTFGNKRELFEKALERFADDMGRQSFLKLLEPGASLEHIRRIFEERIAAMCDGTEPHGCLLSQTAMEVAPHDEAIRDVLLRFLKRTSKTFAIGLEHARDKGEVRADPDLTDGGEFLTGALFSLAAMGRAGFPRESLERYLDNTLAAVAA